MIPAQYFEAVWMEQSLGDPWLPDNSLSYAQALSMDEEDAFPEAQVTALNALGFNKSYVPHTYGGTFRNCETFVAMGRVLARRNMSVAVAYSTMLWSTLGWLGGSDDQKREIARWIISHGSFPCLAYSESEHGADLTSNQLSARLNADGTYTLNGEKWPINRAIRSDFLVLLARTDDGVHMRNHSLFIVRKDQLSRRYYHLPRVKTHGLKGCDISGIGFRDCVIPASCRVGEQGHGLELALKGFQVTRTFCTALSLGVGDTALRLVADYASRRRLYGDAISRLPHVQDVLANTYVSQLIAECVSIVSARGLHVCPELYSSWSSIAKVEVCHLVDFSCQQLASVLGARFYMRDQQGVGIFQKFMRDGAVVSIFDGSSVVCLDSLATLLDTLTREDAPKPEEGCLHVLFDLESAMPDLDYSRLKLFSRQGDPLLGSVAQLIEQLDLLNADESCTAQTLQNIKTGARRFLADVEHLKAQIRQSSVRSGRNSARRLAQAQRYCAVFGVAACMGIWLFNREKFGSAFKSGLWLSAVLQRGLSAEFAPGTLDPALTSALFAQMDEQRQHNEMFSLMRWPLAAAGEAERNYGFDLEKENLDEQRTV
ncbi:acyl-CoA dehydrogenase family protein [Pseudomonas baltica]|uniref:acyl-CoA dehydrogenase family protein n=1 Tax=Pseudomonas baltica TaxID=2762576 RepID=UPI00289FA18F|nr:acyl-CoA dehydrogenase family protein [Pseudomonas baltica]